MEESEDTGVIYEIKNKLDGKIYVGKAYSYVKNGKQKLRKHGADDRLYKHIKAAINGSIDSPALYDAIRKDGKENWEVRTLKVCLKKDLKTEETRFIKEKQSYLPELGYNFFIGDNKPENGDNKEKYEKNKELQNKNRAIGGKLRKKDYNKNLPVNIYFLNGNKMVPNKGYMVQIIIKGKLYRKAFAKKTITLEENLEAAKAYLEKVKKDADNN
jgi:hypothetical protein